MAGVLNKLDQENFVYGQQQVAASKPLNQLRPKTPAAKSSKVSFDENAVQTHAKTLAKGGPSKSLALGGGKNAVSLATPAATKNRAPLGAKTTNAKTKPFGTPAQQAKGGDKPKSASAVRRQSLKISQAQPVKIDILQASEEDLPEIEYMPPPAKDLPDIPEELENGINLSMFENGGMQRDFLSHMQHSIGFDGKSWIERQREREQLLDKMGEERDMALTDYRADCDFTICLHDPECPTEDCKDLPERLRVAKERYENRLAEIAQMDDTPKIYPSIQQNNGNKPKRINITKGPSEAVAKKAVNALATKPKPTWTTRPEQKPLAPRSTTSLSSRSSQPSNTAKPINPSSMRHAASVAASNTTVGYGKGRAVRANLRQGILSPKDGNMKASKPGAAGDKKAADLKTLSPAEYMRLHGEPKLLSEMWWMCQAAGLLKTADEDEKTDKEEDIHAGLFQGADMEQFTREEAEREFELVLS